MAGKIIYLTQLTGGAFYCLERTREVGRGGSRDHYFIDSWLSSNLASDLRPSDTAGHVTLQNSPGAAFHYWSYIIPVFLWYCCHQVHIWDTFQCRTHQNVTYQFKIAVFAYWSLAPSNWWKWWWTRVPLPSCCPPPRPPGHISSRCWTNRKQIISNCVWSTSVTARCPV